jgi:hypothetical protein
MRNASPHVLRAIFNLRPEDRMLSSEEYAVSKLPLPTLEERIDLYSRAVYGPDYAMTAEERGLVRDLILDAMADEAVRTVSEDINNVSTREENSTIEIPTRPEEWTQELGVYSLGPARFAQQHRKFSSNTPRKPRAAHTVAVAFVLVLVSGAAIWMGISKFVHFNSDASVQVSHNLKPNRLEPAGDDRTFAEVTSRSQTEEVRTNRASPGNENPERLRERLLEQRKRPAEKRESFFGKYASQDPHPVRIAPFTEDVLDNPLVEQRTTLSFRWPVRGLVITSFGAAPGIRTLQACCTAVL